MRIFLFLRDNLMYLEDCFMRVIHGELVLLFIDMTATFKFMFLPSLVLLIRYLLIRPFPCSPQICMCTCFCAAPNEEAACHWCYYTAHSNVLCARRDCICISCTCDLRTYRGNHKCQNQHCDLLLGRCCSRTRQNCPMRDAPDRHRKFAVPPLAVGIAVLCLFVALKTSSK